MNKKTLAALTFTAASALSLLAKEEIIMTVNGDNVSRSEFEYLYHKNQQQQVAPQTLDEYAEMFKIYKLKVADAREQRFDTLPEFKKEMLQYKADLAKPYMTDSIFLNNLVAEAFDRSRNEVEAFHIMILKGNTPDAQARAMQTADSIRTALLNGADFGQLARQYSVDQGSSHQGGRMGWIAEGRFPYAFEKTAFSLQPGEISEIVESQEAFHVLKGGKKRPARGTVLTQHIMKMCRPGASAAEEDAAKAAIDSIYGVVVANPDRFEDMARELSDDKGSGLQGGRLQWFGAGMMVEPFDSAAFAMEVGEISKPVRSQYGWHVIRKLDAKHPASLAEMKPSMLQRFNSEQDERSVLIKKNMIANLAAKHKAKLNEMSLDAICNGVAKSGIDSTWIAAAKNANTLPGSMEIAKIGKKSISLADWVNSLQYPLSLKAGESASLQMHKILENYFANTLEAAEQDWLYANQPAYSNLLDEYRDGSLLYEASLRRVWDKAAKDNQGLEAFFEANRDSYSWKKPHVKGILVLTVNDSVADEIRSQLGSMASDADLKDVKKKFVGKASIERVLLEEGQNAMVDNLMFGGDPVQPKNKKYTVYFMWQPKVLNAPETVADVKSLVVNDYQNKLESDWVCELKEKYPVVINQKILRKVK